LLNEKSCRRWRGEGDARVLGAVEPLREPHPGTGRGNHDRLSLSLLEGGLQRIGEAAGFFRVDPQAIDHHEQLGCRGEIRPLRQLIEVQLAAIHENPHEAECPEVLHHQRMRDPGGERERKADHHPLPLRQGQHGIGRALNACPA
jgi:hypothetical protein